MKNYENIPDDQFVDIPGYEGYYQINKNQQVKGLPRYVANKWGRQSLLPERLLNPFRNIQGYNTVVLCVNYNRKTELMHRLLCLTFLPNPENKPFINHINANPFDNRLINLEWCTQKENMSHAAKLGRMGKAKGEKNGMYGKRGEKSVHYGKTRGLNYGAKLVLDTQSGIYYDCCQDAADAKGHKTAVLRHRLNGAMKNNTGLIYA